jgi:hypothetical protein
MRMRISVMADHIDIQTVLGVLVLQTRVAKVTVIFYVHSVLPVCEAIVCGHLLALAKLKKQVGLVHAEVVHWGVGLAVAAQLERETEEQCQDYGWLHGFE